MNDQPFDFTKEYTVAMKHFISIGRDGYECFKDPSVRYIRDVNSSILIIEMVMECLRRMQPGYIVEPQHEERR